MGSTASAHKRRWGQLAYLATAWRMLAGAPSVGFRIEIDGEVNELEACMIMIANCGEIVPPLLKLGQGITPYDGRLDLIAINANSVAGGLRAVWQIARESKGVYGETVFAARFSGARISVSTPGAVQPVELDGELTGDTPFVATAVPGAIQLIHPKG